jgi:hypothetical protein
MLRYDQPFDPLRMTDPELNKLARAMNMAAAEVAYPTFRRSEG